MVNQDPVSLAVSGVVVVILVDYLRAHQGWGWLRLVQGASAFKDTPGLLFTKVMGSGHQGGFSLRPSASHQGLICVFDHADHADQFLAGPWLAAYQERAKQCQASLLAITSCKGAWDGRAFDVTPDDKLGHYAFEPRNPSMAAITRAITAAYKNDFFSESMFVRMRLLRTVGEWVMPKEVVAHG